VCHSRWRRHTNPDAISHGYGHSHSYGHCHCHSECYAYGHCHSECYPYGHSHCDPESYSDTKASPDTSASSIVRLFDVLKFGNRESLRQLHAEGFSPQTLQLLSMMIGD
jgi:hypothetical protein